MAYRILSIVGGLAFMTQGQVVSSFSNTVHETRAIADGAHSSWRAAPRLPPEVIVPVRIALKQQNLAVGIDRLMSMSHPDSSDYGKTLTTDEVTRLFAPSAVSVEAVRDWLVESGVPPATIAHSDSKGWLAVDMTAAHSERLLESELYEFEHLKTGKASTSERVFRIADMMYSECENNLEASLPKLTLDSRRSPISTQPWHPPAPAYSLTPELQACSVNITPPCLRALYGIPPGHINDTVNTLGFYEQGDYYAAEDLDLFFANYAPWVPQGTRPTLQSVDGGDAPYPINDSNVGGEADLDLDIGIALVYPQSVVVYQVDDAIYAPQEVALDNTFNTFLDSLDGSYCDYSAYGITGDSPDIDPKYPDPAAGGYKGQRQCGVYKPTRVISISFGEAEGDFPKPYVERQCNEFMKLSLQGHTILIASGDYGVAAPPRDGSPSGCLSDSGQNQTIFSAPYPNDCPWTTSVGGSMVEPNATARDPESAFQVCSPSSENCYSSTGGFSNYFSTPSYQKAAVAEWFDNHNPGYPTYVANANASNIGEGGGIYNRAGRAVPDVAANAANMLLYVGGELGKFYGASLAAPIWGSVVTLINQQRTIAGKGPVGFLNPVLYANPWALNDITNGSNPGCGTNGFTAVKGWDPVTGLGTPLSALSRHRIRVSDMLMPFSLL
ncbi:hypothetical protein LTR97_009982 [Elasticomyces elasticus]|uniref:Peptidase S53 domain-containing protein n=1 Tax=Elasticomyces elasticus TaxID=574655 RepID=A0AAN8A0T2_9PEZI|nr:hypothetical protein LTR97_009982 [Elasticomyces elasticus]